MDKTREEISEVLRAISNYEIEKIIVYACYIQDGSGIKVRFKNKNNEYCLCNNGKYHIMIEGSTLLEWDKYIECIKTVSNILKKEIEIIYDN